VNDVVYVATSPQTEYTARKLRLDIRRFNRFGRVDLAIDGADQIAPAPSLLR
jgi:ribose 5-phosphate isomerase